MSCNIRPPGERRIYGKNIEEVCDRIKRVNALLKTRNNEGENMFIYFDDYDSLREEYYTGLKQFGF